MLRIITSLFCSASTTASWTHFIAVSKSTISPLRTPRDGACPTPRIFNVPSGRVSPTTTQIFDVPISKPTIKSPFAMFLIFLEEGLQESALRRRRRRRRSRSWTRFGGRSRRRCGRSRLFRRCRGHRFWRRIHWNGFHHPWRFLWLNGVIDHFGRRFLKRDWNIALHEQVHGRDFPMRVVG